MPSESFGTMRRDFERKIPLETARKMRKNSQKAEHETGHEKGGENMAGRPPKALGLVTGHLTNAQKEARAAAEKSMSTGKPMKKWPKTKENPLANKLFGKLAAAYTAIGMNDAMHEAVINRYCIITAECEALETRQKALRAEQENQDAEKTAQLESAIAKIDAALNVRRNMLLAIERENLLTIASKLRAVPKKPQESEEEDPMERVLLQGRRGG